MPKFLTIVRRDAWINYTAEIEAATAEEAATIALEAFKSGDTSVKFEEDGLSEFDDAICDPDDCEELDDAGYPIPLR